MYHTAKFEFKMSLGIVHTLVCLNKHKTGVISKTIDFCENFTLNKQMVLAIPYSVSDMTIALSTLLVVFLGKIVDL